jgi:hypothetical protein
MSTAQTNLREPDQMNWDNYSPATAGKFQRPPDVIGADGKPIQYFLQVKSKFEDNDFSATDEGYRSYQVGPLKVVKSGNGADGYEVRFAYVNVKKRERNGKPIDASSAGDFIKAAGLTAKPQKNAEYDQAVKLAAGRVVPAVLDWEARNKDTGETIRGFQAFPINPETGKREAILHKGDTFNVVDARGVPTGEKGTVQSEVLFANARVRYFRDPNRK